jgi:ketosteroid isomerase-like protein
MPADRNQSLAEVTACEQLRLQAMLARDALTLANLLDDNLTYVHSTGAIMSKDDYLAHVADPTFRYVAASSEPKATHLLGDCAILIASVTATIEKDGHQIALALTTQSAWRRTGDGWRLIASTAASRATR